LLGAKTKACVGHARNAAGQGHMQVLHSGTCSAYKLCYYPVKQSHSICIQREAIVRVTRQPHQGRVRPAATRSPDLRDCALNLAFMRP
jgi:hypothetical protein